MERFDSIRYAFDCRLFTITANPSGSRRPSSGPWTLDLGREALTLMLSWEDSRATWVRSGAILGQPGVILGLYWEELEATWVHLGISFENLVTTWVQGHVLEMPKSFSFGPCAAKRLHDITEVHTEQHQIWKTMILHMFYKPF